MEIFGEAPDSLTDIRDILRKSTLEYLNNAKNNLDTPKNLAYQKMPNISKVFEQKALDLMGYSDELYQNAKDNAYSSTQNAIDQTDNSISAITKGLKNRIEHTNDAISRKLGVFYGINKKEVENSLNNVDNSTKSIWDTVKEKTKEGFNTIKETLTGAGETVKNKAKETLSKTGETLKGAYNTVSSTVNQIFLDISNAISPLTTAISLGLTSLIDSLRELFTFEPDKVIADMLDLQKNLISKMSGEGLKQWREL